MSFKTEAAPGNGSGTYVQRNFPVPKSGSRKARISLIVDMGVQEREPFTDPVTKEEKPQEPCRQIAIFADLTADKVDYGGDIGVQPYRLLLNRHFKGEITGINFYTQPAKDAEGKIMRDKPWCLHPTNLVTKLAKAIGQPDIVNEPEPRAGVDISPLLGAAFMAEVEVKEQADKQGKKDDAGNPIVYKNVNFKGCAGVPHQEDEDGNDIGPIPVPKLAIEPRGITFASATKEDIQFIWANLRKQIKKAKNYEGSNMQKAIEAFEAEQAAKREEKDDKKEESAKAPPKDTKKPKPPAKSTVEDMDDDVPF